jgi:hypothetical protein
MNEKVQAILEEAGLPIEQPKSPDFSRLLDADGIVARHVNRAVKALTLFLRVPLGEGGARPSSQLCEVLMGAGRAQCVALLDAFSASLPEADRMPLLEGAAMLVRLAKIHNTIPWDVDLWKPGEADGGKTKVGIYLEPQTAERMRVCAFERRETISAFVETALVERVSRIEQERGEPIAAREPTSGMSEAIGRRATATV